MGAQQAEELKKRMEEAETKRQQMLEVQKAKAKEGGPKKSSADTEAMSDARREMSKTKEQLDEEKHIALSIRIKPLDLECMDSDELKAKAEELFNITVRLETDKYDFEQRCVSQDYELMELKERQKVQLRQKAMKKGLDPESLLGKHPPKIRMYSKYERRTDTRTYQDRKVLYEGGWEVIRAESLEAMLKKSELDEQLKEYINEWRKTREKEEDELKRMKEKQAKRKEIRAEQEKKLAQQKKEEEDQK